MTTINELVNNVFPNFDDDELDLVVAALQNEKRIRQSRLLSTLTIGRKYSFEKTNKEWFGSVSKVIEGTLIKVNPKTAVIEVNKGEGMKPERWSVSPCFLTLVA